MKNFSPPSFTLIPILFLCSAAVLHFAATQKVSLIHRDSPLSPFYNPNISLADYWSSILQRSDLRHVILQSILANHTSSETARISGLQPQSQLQNPYMFGEYLMKFTAGNPAVEFLGVVDLNGDFVHMKCKGCSDCGPLGNPSYDLEKSSTYANVPCASVVCGNQDEYDCAGYDRCQYTRTGPDGQSTVGILVSDVLRVATYAGSQASFNDFDFGCCLEHCPAHNKVDD